MKLSKITTVVLFALIVGKTLSTGIVIGAQKLAKSTELIVEAMVNILALCYGNEKFAIALYGHLPETFIETLWSRKLIPILTLINDTDCENRPRQHHRKINVFVIMANDIYEVHRAMESFSCSHWYNGRASVLIVSRSVNMNYGCFEQGYGPAYLFYDVWRWRMFNVDILCLHSSKGTLLYGYSPHNYHPPAPWKLTGISFKFREIGKLSIFEREYAREGICKDLDFNKDSHFGGSPVEVWEKKIDYERYKDRQIIRSKYRNTVMFAEQASTVLNTFARQVNRSLRVVTDDSRTPKGVYSVRINFESARYLDTTYPRLQTGLTIVTNFEGNKSQLRKILTVVDVNSRIGTGIALLVTLIFLKLFVRQALLPAILNIVRIVCNAGFRNLPDNDASRIYLAAFFCFVVTMQGIFTGNLASLLTRDVPVEHAKTIQDLRDRNYTIYTPKAFKNLFSYPMYEGRVVLIENSGQACIDYLVHDLSGACLVETYYAMDIAKEYDVYVSDVTVFNQYWAWGTEPGWPLINPFNKIFMTMIEADVVDTLSMRVMRNRLNFVDPDDNDPKVMTLNDLAFAFPILGIGLAIATLCFVVEISIEPIRSRLANCWIRHTKRGKLKIGSNSTFHMSKDI